MIPPLSSLVIAFFLILATVHTAESQAYYSFFYDFNGQQPTTATYQGDAHFPSDSPYLRLTKTDNSGNALSRSTGRVLNSDPVTFWQSGAVTNFETIITFIVKPNPNDNDPADGIAFFIGPFGTTIPVGSEGGSFAIFGASGGASAFFVVEFDVYMNEWDPSFYHIGIDIESRKSVNTTKICDMLVGKEVTLRVNYEGETKLITAVVTSNSERYEVSYVYDLSAVLTDGVQFGIAASTGKNVAVHDVISWSLASTLGHKKSEGEMESASIRQLV